MNIITRFMRSVPTRVVAIAALAVASIVVPASLHAWGPVRDTYTMNNPATKVTFNSITDNPNLGDERNFTGVREVGSAGAWQDTINVTAGKEYEVRVYVHNNAASNLNLVAKNVKAMVNVPSETGRTARVMGFVTSSNATPSEVYDQADFKGTEDFNLKYVLGSAKYYNNVFGKYGVGSGVKLPDTLVTSTGATLGYDKLDGNIPGCFQYAGVVVFHVKPQFAAKQDFTMQKLVSKHGDNKWVENYSAQPGETVDYLLSYQNTGDTQQNNVTFRDTLPAHMNYVAGSAKFGNSQHPSGTPASDNVTGVGVNVGSYAAGANAWLIFSAKVAPVADLACGQNTLKNSASVTPQGVGVKSDTANVTVTRNCPPPTHPAVDINKTVNTKEHQTVKVNEPFTYELVVKNTGDVTLTNVKVKDSAPTGVTFTSADKGTIAANVWNYTIPSLAVNQSITVKITAVVKAYVAGTITNTACVNAPEVNPTNPTVNDDCDGATIDLPVPAAACVLVKANKISRTSFNFDGKAQTSNGATISAYVFTVKNAAGQVVKTVTINSTALTANSGTVSITGVGVYNVSLLVKTSVGNQTAPTCNTTIEVTPDLHPAVDINKTVMGVESKEVTIGTPFTYEVVVKNTGNVTLVNAKVSDSAPAGVKFQSADKGTITANVWNYTIPSLAVNQSITVKITAIVNSYVAGTITNKACVDAAEVTGNPDDCDTANITVKKPATHPAVDINKTVNTKEHQTVKVNEEFTYELVVKNTGDVALTNVKVSDMAPAGVTFLRASLGSIGGIAGGAAWNYTIPSLAVNQSITVKITAVVKAYVAGTITNTACVNAPEVNPTNPTVNDDCDGATIDVTKEPVLIKVCELSTDTIITINEKDFDAAKHSKNLADCSKIQVCELSTKHIITIAKNDFDQTKHSTNLNDCKIKVCRLADKKVVNINEQDFDTTKYSRDLSDCDETPVEHCTVPGKETLPKDSPDCKVTPVTPPELPRTGVADGFVSVIGLGSLAAAAGYYGASRRALRS